MSQTGEIIIFNRYTNSEEVEKVYGEKAVKFAYDSILGKMMGPIIASRFVSQLYGNMQDKDSSRAKVPPFVEKFNIKMEEYQPGSIQSENIEHSYKNFNEFFIRKFKDGQRSYPQNKNEMGACAEARYYAVEKVDNDVKYPVKGQYIKAKDLLGDTEFSKYFEEGPFMIARLCPVDYHRYHYLDNGTTLEHKLIPGDFHSVNPLALKLRNDILIKNERRVSILETENFGKIAYIEVGATCVGKIVQSHDEEKPFKRGEEKGYFLFGGSTVIILGEKGKWRPSEDLLKNTTLGRETYVRLGDTIAHSTL